MPKDDDENCGLVLAASIYDDNAGIGVAALSCTDSSTTSSDASDPGSPYSSTSLEELQNSTMAPRQVQLAPSNSQISPHQWPWNSGTTISLPSPIAPAIASTTNSSNNNNSTTSNNNLKRLDTGLKLVDTPKRMRMSDGTSMKKTSTPIVKQKTVLPEELPPQTKITGYFKSQMKQPVTTVKKDLTNLVIRSREFPKAKVDMQTRSRAAATVVSADGRKKGKTKVTPTIPNKVPIVNRIAPMTPKRPVTIAPRVVTNDKKTPGILSVDQVKHQPTVVLTAIRLPASTQPVTAATEAKPATPKGNPPVFQLPMVSNFLQIPNIITKGSAGNLLMNGNHLTRINGTHPGQYFLNGTTVLKVAASNMGTLTSIDESGGGASAGKSGLLSLSKAPTSTSAQFPTNGFTSPMFMTTTPQGILLNATLPAVITSQYSSLSTGGNLLPSFSTLLQQTQQHHQHHHQASCYQFNQAPVVPNIPPATFTASTPAKMPPVTPIEVPKMSPVTVNVDITAPVAPIPDAKITTIDLRSPTLPTQSPETPAPPILPSPKSLVLEQIQLKTSPDLEVNIVEEVKSPRIDTDLLSANLPECAKSPILSQPKTIRFPPQNGEYFAKGVRKSDGRIVGVCYWDQCTARFDSSSKLLDHLQTQHVSPQTVPFSCLWAGCKVHSRQSCSRRWLEGHVLSHGGPKPFKCIFDGCGQRFGTRVALEKHVNSHLNTTENSNNSSNKRSSDLPVNKLIRRNGKKLRYRRQPWSARMFDYFDSGIMEGLQHRLTISSAVTSGPDGSVLFQGRKLGRRVAPSGITQIYVSWTPANIISDEWIPEPKDPASPITKSVTIEGLSIVERIALQEHLRSLYRRKLGEDVKLTNGCDGGSEPKLKVMKTLASSGGGSLAIFEDFSVCTRKKQKQHRKPPKKDTPS
ncbi:hypothetical protein DMENIID0001_110050 [Sergentomyia squamirostris]